MSRLSTDDLDRIQAYSDKATEGPWETYTPLVDWEFQRNTHVVTKEMLNAAEEVLPIATVVIGPALCIVSEKDESELKAQEQHRANAMFIANARTDIPSLLAELKTARSIIAFFADEQNWQSPSSGFALQYDPEPSPIQSKGRQIARDFLGI